MNEVNKRVAEFMKQVGADEAEMAQKIGKDKSTIYRILSGKTIPSKTTLKLMADAYGVDPDYFNPKKIRMHEFVFPKQNATDLPWKDEAYALIKAEKDAWKAKFDQLFEAVLKGGSLGKYRANIISSTKKNRVMLVRNP